MKNSFLISGAAFALFATPAFAQDSSDESLTGPYIGVIAGYDSVSIDDGIDDASEDDVMYGIIAGYDYDMGNMVIGIEGEYSESNVGISATDGINTVALKAATDLYAGVRVGFKAGDIALLYVKGGYTTGRAEVEFDDGVDFYSEGDNLNGFRIGAGFEYPLGSIFALRAEYRYSDYGDYSYEGFDTGLSATRHQVAVGLTSKF